MCTIAIAIIIIQEIWKLSEIIPKKIVDKFASNPLDRIISNKSFYFKILTCWIKKLWEFYNCRKQRYTLTVTVVAFKRHVTWDSDFFISFLLDYVHRNFKLSLFPFMQWTLSFFHRKLDNWWLLLGLGTENIYATKDENRKLMNPSNYFWLVEKWIESFFWKKLIPCCYEIGRERKVEILLSWARFSFFYSFVFYKFLVHLFHTIPYGNIEHSQKSEIWTSEVKIMSCFIDIWVRIHLFLPIATTSMLWFTGNIKWAKNIFLELSRGENNIINWRSRVYLNWKTVLNCQSHISHVYINIFTSDPTQNVKQEYFFHIVHIAQQSKSIVISFLHNLFHFNFQFHNLSAGSKPCV